MGLTFGENMSEGTSAAPVAAPVESSAPASEGSQSTSQAQPSNSSAPIPAGLPEAAQDAVAAAIEDGATPKEVASMIKKFKLKVDGKEVEREVDLSDDNFIRQQLQLAEVSKKRMQESSELKKMFEKEIGRLRETPWEVLQELGLNPDDLAEARIAERIEQLKKSPEQLEREQIQKELAAAREEAKQLKEEKERIEFDKLKERAAVQIENEIIEALDAHKSLPKSPFVMKKIADQMLWAMDNGFEDVSVGDILPLVEKELKDDLGRHFDEMPEEMLEAYLGKKNIDRLRKKRLNAMKVPDASPAQVKATANSVKQPAQPQKKISSKNFFRNLGK